MGNLPLIVSPYSDIMNAIKFVIDGHRLFVYRSDYTIYPMNSLK